MTTERIELQSGVWLNLVQTDRFKTGCFSFNLMRPLQQDAAANALIPSVLLRGCQNYPDMRAISQHLDTLYGAGTGTLIRKKGEVQSVGMYADFLEDRYADSEPVFHQMMEFLQNLIFSPSVEENGFVADYVASEKQNLINTIDSRINEKRSYAVSRLLKHMCAGEAYAMPRLGEKTALETADSQTLYSQWNRMLSTSRVELFYLGQQPRDTVLKNMEQLTSKLPKRDVLENVQTQIVLPKRDVQFVEEALDVTQGKLTMGLRTPITVQDPRYPAMMLLNTVFGAGMTSKLFLKIREEQSLCYYANSSMDKFKGIMVIGSGIEFEKYEVARDGILEQLDLCKQGQISEEELEQSRNYLLSALRTGNDSPGRLDDFAVGQSIAGLSYSMEDLGEQLRTVTLDQVVEAANTLTLDTVYFLKGVEA